MARKKIGFMSSLKSMSFNIHPRSVAPSSFDFGINVVEIFVTDKIDLPSFALFNLPKELPFFPLEIHSYLSNVPGVVEIFEVKEIAGKKKK